MVFASIDALLIVHSSSVFKFELNRVTGGKTVNVGNVSPRFSVQGHSGSYPSNATDKQSWVSSTLHFIQTLVMTHTVSQIIALKVGFLSSIELND